MQKGVIRVFFLTAVLIPLLTLSACNSTSSSTALSQTTTAATSSIINSTVSTATASSTLANTFNAMATLGKTIYDKYGASSHGQNGQGGSSPALMGSHATLTKYNTAQGLLTYISTNMPLEAPGSLSHQDYLDILCYLLVQNNYVPADTVFNESQLNNITLK
jgi:cytochrome c